MLLRTNGVTRFEPHSPPKVISRFLGVELYVHPEATSCGMTYRPPEIGFNGFLRVVLLASGFVPVTFGMHLRYKKLGNTRTTNSAQAFRRQWCTPNTHVTKMHPKLM